MGVTERKLRVERGCRRAARTGATVRARRGQKEREGFLVIAGDVIGPSCRAQSKIAGHPKNAATPPPQRVGKKAAWKQSCSLRAPRPGWWRPGTGNGFCRQGWLRVPSWESYWRSGYFGVGIFLSLISGISKVLQVFGARIQTAP